jgi:hypothetical protein
MIICGVCMRGRERVRNFGTWWGLVMFSVLSQIAGQHLATKAQHLEDLVVVTRFVLYSSKSPYLAGDI